MAKSWVDGGPLPVESCAVSNRIRALRGATTVDRDVPEHIDERVQELIREMLARNALDESQLISLLFSATPDVRSRNPATSARALGLHDVPLLGLQEMGIDGMLGLCVRVMMHLEWDRPRGELRHVFLHGAGVLRPDLADPDPAARVEPNVSEPGQS